MANYSTQGNKTVKCTRCGCNITIPFQTTVFKCSKCNEMSGVKFFGTVKDKYDNYIY